MKNSKQASGEAHALKCELAGEVLRSTGKLRLRVNGWSMLPAIWPGDTVRVQRAQKETVSEGDIVLYARDRRLFMHRVVAGESGGDQATILTRGDAMPQADPPVPIADLLGKVCFVERDGSLIAPKKTPRFLQRSVATLCRHSQLAARVVTGVRSALQTS